MNGPWVGRFAPRREDDRLLRGAGRFVDDIRPRDCLHLAFARSDLASGRIAAIEVAAARAVPGVVAVFTGRDLAGLGRALVNEIVPGMRAAPFAPLAQDRVEAVGQAFAAVAATSAAAAQDAVAAIVLSLEEEDAAAAEAPEAARLSFTRGDPDAAFAAAAVTVEMAVARARVAPAALEPRAALAEPAGRGFTLHLSTQTPFRARSDLARILGLAVADVTVVAPDIGGAFGAKASLHPEEAVVAWAALRLGRPVAWRASRSEEMLAATQGRGADLAGALALDPDGAALALRMRVRFPLGHWTPYSAAIPLRNALRIPPGPYRIAASRAEGTAAFEPCAAVGIYRGAGRPEAAQVLETLMDRAARATGLDPLDLRRRNVWRPGDLPRALPSGDRIDSGDFPALIDRAAAAADYAPLLAGIRARRAAGEAVGLGIALYVEPCGQGWESAAARLDLDGRAVVTTGTTAQGQGRATASAQIAADILGLPPERILARAGDTRDLDDGVGALASRGTAIGGAALAEACAELRVGMLRAAAAALGCAPEAVALGADGAAAGGRRLGWAGLAAAMARAGVPSQVRVRRLATAEAWSSGCVIAAVRIDRDTGAPTVERLVWADDAGVIVNPMLAEGQLVGGMVQGFGETFLEAMVHDRDGQLRTGSLMDYALPRASDAPRVELASCVTPAPDNPLGAKGVGEAGCIGPPAALFNAVEDAISPWGGRLERMPLTPETIWRAMGGGRRGAGG